MVSFDPRATMPTPRAFRTTPADHRFFSAMSIIAATVVLTGFGRTYAPKVIAGTPAVPSVIHLHAAVFTVWLGLFIAQARLVARGRTDVHRRLGRASVAFAALMLVVGVRAAVTVARAGHRGIPGVEFPTPEGFLLLNLASVSVFTLLVAAGWAFRRQPQAHKRLMLMATVVGLMPPGISRLPVASGHMPIIAATVTAFVLAGPAYDLLTRRRLHPAYVPGLVLFAAILPPVVTAVSATSAWQAVAAWLMR